MNNKIRLFRFEQVAHSLPVANVNREVAVRTVSALEIAYDRFRSPCFTEEPSAQVIVNSEGLPTVFT